MPRPFCRRCVGWRPGTSSFFAVSSNRPHRAPDTISLNLDELEAFRLANLEGLHQEQAAEKMSFSRPTFACVFESVRKKVTEALVRCRSWPWSIRLSPQPGRNPSLSK